MVSLEDMKDYLKVDGNEENTLITDLIDTAHIYVDQCCGTDYKSNDGKVKLANLLIKKLVADMYSNREGTIDKQIQDRKVTTILDMLSNGA